MSRERREGRAAPAYEIGAALVTGLAIALPLYWFLSWPWSTCVWTAAVPYFAAYGTVSVLRRRWSR